MTTTTNDESVETYTRHQLEMREALKPDGVWVRAHDVRFDRAEDVAKDLKDYRDRANVMHPGCWRLLLVTSKTTVKTTNEETVVEI